VELAFEANSLDLSLIPKGCLVWKTDDPALRKKLESTYTQDKIANRLPITAELRGSLGESVTLTLASDDGNSSAATWPGPLEMARNKPTSKEEITEQLNRLGDTPFRLADVSIQLPDSVLIPRSVLNDLRRQASAGLANARKKKPRSVNDEALNELRADARRRQPAPESAPCLTVMARSLEQLQAVCSWVPPEGCHRPAVVYCDFEDLRLYKDAVPLAKAAGLPIGLAPLRIGKPGEEGFQSIIVRANPDIVLVRNLAAIDYFRNELPHAVQIGDFSLNVANDLTAEVLFAEGLQRLVPSFDLNWDQFRALLEHSRPELFEPVIHQHMPMFHMEHCVFAAFLSTGKDHRDCGRPCDTHKVDLKDRVGAHFPVLPDTGCRNTVFNSLPQSAAEYVGRMRDLGVRRFRIDLLRETPEQIRSLLDRYARVVAGTDDGRETWRQVRALNQIGVTRGTMQLA
jgi:putative protease